MAEVRPLLAAFAADMLGGLPRCSARNPGMTSSSMTRLRRAGPPTSPPDIPITELARLAKVRWRIGGRVLTALMPVGGCASAPRRQARHLQIQRQRQSRPRHLTVCHEAIPPERLVDELYGYEIVVVITSSERASPGRCRRAPSETACALIVAVAKRAGVEDRASAPTVCLPCRPKWIMSLLVLLCRAVRLR